jgi:hypothetical protein
MVAINADEVVPGLVVFLDQALLASNDLVTRTQDLPSFSARTFVCLSVDGEISEWVPFTTEYRRERLPIRREWRSSGHPQWLRDEQYLTDGANIWRGPHGPFVEASWQEVTNRSNRARTSGDGLAAIQVEVEAQRHRRDR